MGLDAKLLPDRILRRMEPRDRPPGNAGLTAPEATEKANRKLEREEQRLFAAWLNLHALPHCWHRTDRATGCLPGVFDFWVGYESRSAWIEFKRHPGAFMSLMSPAQKEFAQKLSAQGLEQHLVTSAAEAIAIVKSWSRTQATIDAALRSGPYLNPID